MPVTYDYDQAFAENGQKADIDDDKYSGGWLDVVGGINGIPTVQQFNAIMNRQEAKVNDTRKYVEENVPSITRITEDELDDIFDGTYTGDTEMSDGSTGTSSGKVTTTVEAMSEDDISAALP